MSDQSDQSDLSDTTLTDQLVRMQGELFRAKGIDGKGIRIAVLDGGFPKVNTHIAFKHLRDNGQILKTWNFPNHKENVYGWNGHGTMTLSNIAGRKDGKDLGLATGAEFLLARTEVEPEPFKEEVWWMQAMEWADKNGANLISSSLGYGKDRYYTKDMDGKSYVAKAGNIAARKGILVVCSAGNEAMMTAGSSLSHPATPTACCASAALRTASSNMNISRSPASVPRPTVARSRMSALSPTPWRQHRMVAPTDMTWSMVPRSPARSWRVLPLVLGR